MHITVNGQIQEISSGLCIQDLLQKMGWGQRAVVVEMNQEAIFPREYDERSIPDGAKIEVVMLASGG